MNVYQVKEAIKKTDCAAYTFSGLYCSEPIMSKNDEGELIDNYVIFSRNADCSMISAPYYIFGIYSEKGWSAYIDDTISDKFFKDLYSEKFEKEELMREAYTVYLELFPMVREMYQLECKVDAQVVLNYVEALRRISGNTLFDFCKQLFPLFFEWAETL